MAATVKMTSFKRNSCFSTLNLAHQVLVALILICDVLTDFQKDLKFHGKKNWDPKFADTSTTSQTSELPNLDNQKVPSFFQKKPSTFFMCITTTKYGW